MCAALWVMRLGLVLVIVNGCDDGGGETDADTDADADADVDADADGDGDGCADPCGAGCCAEGERCFRDGCIADAGTCAAGEACQGDTTCVEGVCAPFGLGEFDSTCTREPEPLDSFEPQIQCEWPGLYDVEDPSSLSVRVPPVIGDLEGDDEPEIVFVTWVDGGPTRIRAIHGSDCSEAWSSSHPHESGASLLLADLDVDGMLEVCGRGEMSRCVPFCLRGDGTLLWEGHDAAGTPVAVDCSYNRSDVGVAAVDVDGDGSTELVVGVSAFDGATGLLRSQVEAPTAVADSWSGTIPGLADIDGDGHVEALTGGWVVDLATGELEADWGTAQGYSAVAELVAEHPGPEVVVVAPSLAHVRVHAADGTLLFSHAVPGGAGGPPTVADLDGDGRAEFSAAGNSYLTAYDLDCVGTAEDPPDPATCAAAGSLDGVMWSVETHEYSSGITGSSVFDFEGDGAVEVVYADECWARIYDGRTGAIKFSAPHESITGIEYPTIADVDGDFFTEIVVPHEAYPGSSCPSEDPMVPGITREPGRAYNGITVYRDRQDRWAPSRPLWSQHAEHYTDRNDNGTVPTVESPSWEGYNSYRQAHPREGGTAIDSPDLTVGGLEAPACDAEAAMQPLTARVCNRGTLPVAAGVDVSFHLGSAAGDVLCEAATDQALEPGECDEVSCQWAGVPLEVDHLVVAVVDGDEATALAECHEDNNTATDEVRCPPLVY